MRQLPAHAEDVVAETARIATWPTGSTERAQALLEPLRRITPFDAALICLYDPQHRRQVPLVREWYGAAGRLFGSTLFVADLERTGLHRSSRCMRLRDCPVPPEELPAWAEYLHPAGFREGVGVALFAAGRHLGLLGLTSADPRPATDDACALLERVAPLVAHAVDPLRTVAALAGMVADAVAGVAVGAAGNALDLPGLPGDDLLTDGSPLLAEVTDRVTGGQAHAVFLCPRPGGALLRVTGLACPAVPPYRPRAVVLLSPPPDLHGLTRRELEVLGLLVEGGSNACIAQALARTPRTVAAHVERIMVKLGAGSRTIAAVQAARQGLFIPAELTLRVAGGRR
jgi:DNA-binding CsgD family transcriptional regulator